MSKFFKISDTSATAQPVSFAPYQLFFPVGILSSILAVGVWLVQNLNWFESPVLLIHSKLIVGGFLWSFIVGFLMTAVPKMTGTRSASRLELGLAVGLMSFQIIQSWNLDGRWFYAGNAVLIAFLIIYGGRRILNKKKQIPVFFSHVFFGMMLALAGTYFHFHSERLLGIHLYHVGAVLMLVLGIGTRFFSFLSGLPSEFETASKAEHWMFHGLGLLTAGLLFFAGKQFSIAYLGLSIVTSSYLIFVWRIFRKSQRPSPLKVGVRLVALMIPFSFLMCWLEPVYYVTWLHLLFIGCFGLITYAVATRVTLAHGSYSLDFEIKSPSLWIFLSLLFFAILARVAYGYSGGAWKEHLLHLAVCFWILAILCWGFSFAKRIFKPGELKKPSC